MASTKHALSPTESHDNRLSKCVRATSKNASNRLKKGKKTHQEVSLSYQLLHPRLTSLAIVCLTPTRRIGHTLMPLKNQSPTPNRMLNMGSPLKKLRVLDGLLHIAVTCSATSTKQSIWSCSPSKKSKGRVIPKMKMGAMPGRKLSIACKCFHSFYVLIIQTRYQYSTNTCSL